MIVGITGSIGSGKSFVSHYLKSLNYLTFDSDDFVKQAYYDKDILSLLNKHFDCVINNVFNKQILKSKLNDENLKILNSIIHPYVINKIKELKTLYKKQIIFVEIPLLFEENLQYLCDYTLAIDIEDNLRDKRLLARDEKNYSLMKKLEKKQFSSKEKAKKADFVIINNGDDEFLFKQIEKLLIILKRKDTIDNN